MVVKTNKDRMMKQALIAKIAPPVMPGGGIRSTYLTTWDGRPKIGIGVGGIKYNVKVGDTCLGWPETEYLEPGVALMGVDEKPLVGFGETSGTAEALLKFSCIGNKVTMVSGSGKGVNGVITGKGGVAGTRRHLLAHFLDGDLDKLDIGDKARVDSEGVSFEVEGFDGRMFNISPAFFEAMSPKMEGDVLELPVVMEIPVIALGIGVGGGSAETGNWCIQSNPPHLVKQIGIQGLRFGDLVACRDALMSYGKGFYKGAVSVGVVTTGGSDVAGQGPGVLAIAASKRGKIKTRIDTKANLVNYLGLEG
jgi:hypothetical protein